jgi:hypothetical protein
MQRSFPRASRGLNKLAASIPPPSDPRPAIMRWSSSTKRMTPVPPSWDDDLVGLVGAHEVPQDHRRPQWRAPATVTFVGMLLTCDDRVFHDTKNIAKGGRDGGSQHARKKCSDAVPGTCAVSSSSPFPVPAGVRSRKPVREGLW